MTKDYYLLSSVIPKYGVYFIKYWINKFCLIIYPEELKNKMNKNTNIKYKYPTNTYIYLFFDTDRVLLLGVGMRVESSANVYNVEIL